MKAIRLHKTGGPEVLQVDEVDTPKPGLGEVLIRAHSIGVGLPDQLIRTGRYPWMPALPTIPGIEMSGTVAAIGTNVTKLKEGESVVVSAVPERGCYAEYMVADANWVFPCSEAINLSDAACLINYRVAWNILHTAARVRAGDTVVIVGAAGGVGNALLQLAKVAELVTVALTRSPLKVKYLIEQGADYVIDTSSNDLSKQIRTVTDGRGVDFFIDPVGGVSFVNHLDLLAPMGMLIMYGLMEGFPPDGIFRAQCKNWARSPAVRLFSIHSYDDQPEVTETNVALLLKMIEDIRIKPMIYAEFPLNMASEAHRLLDEGDVIGKIILQPGRTKPLYTNFSIPL
jgi:NADPH2:quinone reductase